MYSQDFYKVYHLEMVWELVKNSVILKKMTLSLLLIKLQRSPYHYKRFSSTNSLVANDEHFCKFRRDNILIKTFYNYANVMYDIRVFFSGENI